ncbi:MAG: DsbA family protein, partial [Deltaproteobacteria bacterium]|nr:DsbA family protein [Deltaproteobacteria bacterium]
MNQRHFLQGLGLTAALGASLALVGCQGSGAFASLNEKLSEITDNQAQLLARMDGLDAKMVELAKAPPAQPANPRAKQGPQPGKPDPSATYKVALGDAHAKGSEEALVTIVAWSDFQCPYCSRVVPTLSQIEKEY